MALVFVVKSLYEIDATTVPDFSTVIERLFMSLVISEVTPSTVSFKAASAAL